MPHTGRGTDRLAHFPGRTRRFLQLTSAFGADIILLHTEPLSDAEKRNVQLGCN